MVVLAPTRELAIQIADQAEILVAYHNNYRHSYEQLTVACIYGGVKMQRDVRLLTGDHQGRGKGKLPTILVSTPARLLEHLEGNSPLNAKYKNNYRQQKGGIGGMQQRSKNKFARVIAETKIVVLDETDRLLQKSNQYDTQRILSFMARTDKRQTLLFAATLPRSVRRLLLNSSILQKKKKKTSSGDSAKENSDDDQDFIEVDCIGDGDGKTRQDASNLDTSSLNRQRINESYVVLENMSQFIPLLLAVLRREQQRDSQNYKILVFFPAVRMVRFFFQFFTIGGKVGSSGSNGNTSPLLGNGSDSIWEIHSRMSQSSRTRASNAFRNASKGILFSSDVSARGLDYPEVSLVVQMGAPSNEQEYIHRIGRTGRAGHVGKGLLVLLPFEKQQQQMLEKNSHDDNYCIKEDKQLTRWLRSQKEQIQENGKGERYENTKNTSLESSLYQQCQDDLESTRLKIRSGHVVLTPSAESAYKAFLAHYVSTLTNSNPNGVKENHNHSKSSSNKRNSKAKYQLLAQAEDFARGTGLAYTPEDPSFLSKLGIPH